MLLFTIVTALTIAALQLIEPTAGYAVPDQAGIARRESPSDTPAPVPFPFDDDDSNEQVLEKTFEAVASIPYGVLDDGEEATNTWLIEHGYRHPGPSPRSLSDAPPLTPVTGIINVKRQGWASIIKCAFEIGKVILESSIPLAKLRRIKELIELLGGARQVGKMLLKARSWDDLKNVGGPLLYELGDLLFGFSDVAQACFGAL